MKSEDVVKGVPPLVFMFKTESYKILDAPEEIQEWEKLMKERVGFNAEFANLSGTCCECSSGGQSDDCDQD